MKVLGGGYVRGPRRWVQKVLGGGYGSRHQEVGAWARLSLGWGMRLGPPCSACKPHPSVVIM